MNHKPSNTPEGKETVPTADMRDIIHHAIATSCQKNEAQLYASWIETPLGFLLAIADHQALHLLEFSDREHLPLILQKLQIITNSGIIFKNSAPTASIKKELDAYFSGRSSQFHTKLLFHAPPFTRSAWLALSHIQAGQTCSYKEFAANYLNKPTAIRAVARANRDNHILIVLPCHRIIGNDGALVGYSGGLWRKKWLLHHEKHAF